MLVAKHVTAALASMLETWYGQPGFPENIRRTVGYRVKPIHPSKVAFPL